MGVLRRRQRKRYSEDLRRQVEAILLDLVVERDVWRNYLFALACRYLVNGHDVERFTKDMLVPANEYGGFSSRLPALIGSEDEIEQIVRERALVAQRVVAREGKTALGIVVAVPIGGGTAIPIRPPIPTWPARNGEPRLPELQYPSQAIYQRPHPRSWSG